MGINEALYSRLSSYTDLTDLISTRIYRVQAPENTTFPYVTFGIDSQFPVHAMGADAGLEGPGYQFDVWADDTDEMEDVAIQVKAALRDFSGTVAGVVIQRIFYDNEIDLPDEDTNKSRIIYHKEMDFTVWHEG